MAVLGLFIAGCSAGKGTGAETSGSGPREPGPCPSGAEMDDCARAGWLCRVIVGQDEDGQPLLGTVCAPECSDDTDCPTGYSCDEEALCTLPCSAAAPCPDGMACDGAECIFTD